MRATGIKGYDNLRMRIARIEISDLHADRRIAESGFAFELAGVTDDVCFRHVVSLLMSYCNQYTDPLTLN